MDWKQITDARVVDRLDTDLQASEASIYQFPFWNRALDMRGYTSTFHLATNGDGPAAFACAIEVGAPGFRFALVNHGPVVLQADLAEDAVASFLRHLAGRYAFAKVAPRDAAYEPLLRTEGLTTTADDSFPFYAPPHEALLVRAVSDPEELLQAFSQTARRMVRKAARSAYEITTTDAPDAFEAAWPLFERLSDRKGFTYRPLQSYLELIRGAQPHGLVQVHTASVDGKPVQCILVLRDGNWAWYVSGALDVEGIIDNASPSFLLHFHAMQTLSSEVGDIAYNLGTRSGDVAQFKERFRPELYEFPRPRTIVFDPVRYRLYRQSVLRYQAPLRHHARRLGRKLLRRA